MAAPISNGFSDAYFIAEVRRSLRDQAVTVQESPASDGQTGALGSPSSKPIRLQRAPVSRTSIFMSAPAGVNQPGFASYLPLFDPPPPIFNPFVAPTLSDGGAGTFSAGNYQVVYTYVVSGVEQGMSPSSNTLALGASRRLQVGALSNIPTGVASLNFYLVSSPSATVGLLGSATVTNGATPVTTFNAGGNGILPAVVIVDTGELFFPVAPISGTVNISYQSSRFGDQQVTDALYEGLDLLWPEVWTPQPFDVTSVLPSPTVWEYALPVAQYGDPRTVIQEVETRPPSAFIIFERKSGWRFINDSVTPTLVFDRPPPVGGAVRITYITPYTSLSQVPSIAQFLPVYYANARLLSDQETMRSRADDLPALTGENAGSEKGGSQQTAAWWLQTMFATALNKLSLGFPARRSVMYRVAEKLNLGPVWQGAP